jgi:transposase
MFIVPKTRPPYPEEFRCDAVGLVGAGRSVRDVSGSLGVSRQSLRSWVKQDQLNRRERDDGLSDDEKAELRELRKRVRRLEQEKEILKRAAAFFAAETETR